MKAQVLQFHLLTNDLSHFFQRLVTDLKWQLRLHVSTTTLPGVSELWGTEDNTTSGVTLSQAFIGSSITLRCGQGRGHGSASSDRWGNGWRLVSAAPRVVALMRHSAGLRDPFTTHNVQNGTHARLRPALSSAASVSMSCKRCFPRT